jgi:hypothetical protein
MEPGNWTGFNSCFIPDTFFGISLFSNLDVYYLYNSSRKVQIEGKILKYYAKEWDLTLVDRIIIYSNNRWQILFSVFGFPGWSNCVIFVKKGQGFKDRFQVYLNYSELKKFKDYLIKEFPGIEWVEVNSIDMFMKVLKEI